MSRTADHKTGGSSARTVGSGATVAAITEDLSTSGGKSAFRRAGLGPYLTDQAKIDLWDTLVVTKLDRACRNVADYLKLAAWCDRNSKRFVVLDDPSLDTSTPQGRAMANMRAVFAQYEREMGKVRNKERYEELKETGKWVGGRVNYGYRHDKQTRQLVPDEGGTADVLRTMADMAINDQSQWTIARWLNDNGHPTGTGKKWTQDTVRRVLWHEATAALLGEQKAGELAAALRRRERHGGERANSRGLLGVVFCAQCGKPLYCNIMPERESGGYYRHNRDKSADIPCKVRVRRYDLEDKTEDSLLFLYGNLEYAEYEFVPGDDHQTAIHALERDIDLLEKVTGADTLIDAKRAEITHLREMPFDPDHFEPVPKGIKVRAHWETLDDQGKAEFLRKRGVRVIADKTHFEFHGGLLAEFESAPGTLEDARERQIS